MRRVLLSFFMLFGMSLSGIYAQNQWVIRFNDGTEIPININEIQEMYPVVNDSPIVVPPARQIVFDVFTLSLTRSADNSVLAALNNQFVVEGVKDNEGTQTVVFDNYNVNYTNNTAGTTTSNTSGWDYVGQTNINGNIQTIKYWDYSSEQYNFIAYSTGKANAVYDTSATITDGQVLVSAIDASKMNGIKDGTGSIIDGAYTIEGKVDDLSKVYIADNIVCGPNDYGKEVKINFRSLSTKIRLGFYETIPGYSVRNLKFHSNDDTVVDDKVRLYKENAGIFSEAGKYIVYYPTTGNDNVGETDYNKAHVAFVPDTNETTEKNKVFGTLDYTQGKEHAEPDGNYLGRYSSASTFARNSAGDYYTKVFPNETGTVLNIKVDYELISIDGSGETISVKGATAQIPVEYSKWEYGHSYTYIFKINDMTGLPPGSSVSELFPITFDAIVIEDSDGSSQTIVSF